jgi:hypothetical protein
MGQGLAMKRYANFDSFSGEGWPDLKWLERYFVAPPGQQWFYSRGRSDSARFTVKGVEGTEHLELYKGRIDIDLDMIGNPQLGVFLMYERVGRRHKETRYSKGDPKRLHEWVENAYGDLIPVGLFVPFEMAWTALKDFIKTDGELPRSIEWIKSGDLPPGTWPDRTPPD